MGVFTVAAAISRILAGPLIDGRGRRIVMVAGFAVLAVGILVCGLMPTTATLVIGRFLQGIGFASATTAASAAASDTLPNSRMSEGISYYGLGQALATSVGPAFALFLIDTDPAENLFFVLAGGGLAASYCEYLGEEGLAQPDAMILLSPWVDVSMSNPDIEDYESADPMLSAYGLTEMGRYWAGDLDLTDYRVSPLYGDVSVLQNVCLFVGAREIFYPDVTEFYTLLQDNGVASELYVGEGMNHDYPLYPIPEAVDAWERICELVETVAADAS